MSIPTLPEPGITTALVLDEVGRRVPMKLVGAYYTADQMREYVKAALLKAAEHVSDSDVETYEHCMVLHDDGKATLSRIADELRRMAEGE